MQYSNDYNNFPVIEDEELEMLYDWIDIFGIIPQRKRVGQSNGIIFIIHPNEQGHNRGHVHAQYQGMDVQIGIPDGEEIDGSLPPAKKKIASKWVKDNADQLVKQWNKLTNGVKIPV